MFAEFLMLSTKYSFLFFFITRHWYDNGYGRVFWDVCYRTLESCCIETLTNVSGGLELSKAGWTF